MKILLAGILSAVLGLVILVLAGCGGGSETDRSSTTASSNSATTQKSSAASAATTPTSAPLLSQSNVSGLTWDDMPLFAGAKQIQKAKWSIPQSQDQDYTKMEWRFYETGATSKEVSAFYKDKMPAVGWTEAGWMDTEGNSWGWYSRNDEKDAAMVYVVTDNEKVTLALWRATGKTSSGNPATTGQEEETTTTTSTASTSATSKPSTALLNWDDMPVYSGAKQVQQASWSVPQSEDQDYAKMEWRYYTVNATAADVATFYKDQMPAIGWTETGWMDTESNSWGWYSRNEEKDAAMVYVVTEDEKVTIALWRATR
jgi:hypothetical protein